MTATVTLSPLSLSEGDSLTAQVAGLQHLASQSVSLVLASTDTIETAWTATLGLTLGADGSGLGEWAGVGLSRESAVFATRIEFDGEHHSIDATTISIVNPTAQIDTAADAQMRLEALNLEQEARYASGLGDPAGPGNVEHRVLCAIERLLVTTPRRLAGVQILPVAARPRGEEQLPMIDALLEQIGWPTRVDPEAWGDHVEPSRPWTAIVCQPVWAPGFEEAALEAWSARDDLLAVLGLTRGARGRPVATIIEQRQPNDSIKHRVYVEDARYTGNMVGGFISGEDQTALLMHQAAMHSDPLLRLCVDLYSEALGDPSLDAQYLRLWSVLETLSGARLPRGQVVHRLDGTVWPGQYNTTSSAAPRVYQLVSDHLQQRGIDEGSFVGPATDLYEAVRAWYGRRNATGHYGRLVVGEARQAGQGWYSWATRTVPAQGDPDAWLMTLQHVGASVLQWELMAVGRPLIA